MATADQDLQRGLPANIDAERAILGAILIDNYGYTQASAASLSPQEFSLDSHRRIYQRIVDLGESGRAIDIVTLTEELSQKREVEAIGGVSYLSSLTEGLPYRPNIDHYVRIVKDKALLRGVIQTANAAISRASEQAEPAADVLSSVEADLFKLSDQRLGVDFKNIHDIVKESFGSIDELLKRGKRITGLATGYYDLDEITSGLQPSELIIIAARPSMGKTALAINIAENAAIEDKKVVAVFSLEMSREALVLRMLSSQSQVDSQRVRTGTITRDDARKLSEALEKMVESPLYIDDTPGISLTEMRAKVRRLQHSEGRVDLIVVDYLQLMAAVAGRRYENRTQEVSAISRGLKMLAKEMRVPVIALSQLSRAPETRGGKEGNEPKLSDLRESGSIEQDADVVAFIFRPEYYDRDNVNVKGKAKIIVAKQRNGPTGVIQVGFVHSCTRFNNLDKSEWID
jgi:replicative DNA helicase